MPSPPRNSVPGGGWALLSPPPLDCQTCSVTLARNLLNFPFFFVPTTSLALAGRTLGRALVLAPATASRPHRHPNTASPPAMVRRRHRGPKPSLSPPTSMARNSFGTRVRTGLLMGSFLSFLRYCCSPAVENSCLRWRLVHKATFPLPSNQPTYFCDGVVSVFCFFME
mgnify:CR=1 FL=1